LGPADDYHDYPDDVLGTPCHCGCMETGQCKCKNCCERTADPTWKADPEYKMFQEWKKAKAAKPWEVYPFATRTGVAYWFVSNRGYPVPSDSPHYATEALAQAEADKRNGKPVKAADELSKPYAKAWQAQGWTWEPKEGCWVKYPTALPDADQHWPEPPPWSNSRPSFAPMQSFGGFGGGCASGSCGR